MPLRALEPKCTLVLGGEWRIVANQRFRSGTGGVGWRALAAHLLRICYGSGLLSRSTCSPKMPPTGFGRS
jgi:hypothetical protein